MSEQIPVAADLIKRLSKDGQEAIESLIHAANQYERARDTLAQTRAAIDGAMAKLDLDTIIIGQGPDSELRAYRTPGERRTVRIDRLRKAKVTWAKIGKAAKTVDPDQLLAQAVNIDIINAATEETPYYTVSVRRIGKKEKRRYA